MGQTARRAPTHILRITVPLDLSERAPDFDPIQDAIRVSLGISRAAYADYICDDVVAELEEPEPPSRGQNGV